MLEHSLFVRLGRLFSLRDRRLRRVLLRPSFRFFSFLIASFVLTGFLSQVGDFYYPFQPQPAIAQVSVDNRAGGSFTDAAGNPGAVTSNTTTIATAGSAGLTIIKTADRAAVEPGDVVVYRLLVRNTSTRPIAPITIEDRLPLGVRYVENSFTATPFRIRSTRINGRTFTLGFGNATLNPGDSFTVAYAALITPDAVRGNGRNVAQASAPGVTSTATFRLTIRPGILADCGTIVGRVFVDRNFDGEQQPGEPGVPNAVVFMDDGNRIVTDVDGLFSIANVISGNRVGTLDLSSLPGYTLAPNLYRLSDNSQSRLVRLEPGGLARMNFAVTPAFGEGQEQ